LEELESNALSLLKSNIDNNEIMAVSFSGGKDSLVVLHLASRVGIDRAVFADTSVEFPDNLEYVDSLNLLYNIDIVKAPVDFFDMVELIGLPSRRFRWCCEVFKFAPMVQYAKDHNISKFITGLRMGESRFRQKYRIDDKNPIVQQSQLNPILYWQTKDVLNYIEKWELPTNPLYQQYDRLGCWVCPYRTKNDWSVTKKYYPDLYHILENHITTHAKRNNIPRPKEFIEDYGWTRFIQRRKRKSVGHYCIVSSGNGETSIEITSVSNNDAQIISRLLPIVTSSFQIQDTTISLTISKNVQLPRLKILLEKAVNCTGCGTCIMVCDANALELNNNKVDLIDNRCTHCQRCISSTADTLRSGCVIRNYTNELKDFSVI
jgi:phosphoadenosine phosphosulfate reductase